MVQREGEDSALNSPMLKDHGHQRRVGARSGRRAETVQFGPTAARVPDRSNRVMELLRGDVEEDC